MSILKRRAGAYLIDLASVWLGHKILYSAFLEAASPNLKNFPWTARNQFFEQIYNARPTTYLVCFLAYFVISTWLGDGQTIGQRMMGIRVEFGHLSRFTNREILSYLLRGIGLFLCQSALGIPFLISCLTKDGRGIQDWISSSRITTSERRARFTVIYGEHHLEEKDHYEQTLQSETEIQLALPLDLKNPGIIQLHPGKTSLPLMPKDRNLKKVA